MKIGIKKLLSVLVTACFVLTSIGGQAAASVAANMRATEQYKQIFSDFMLPYSYGKITDAHFASTDRVIINIQDLHCHPKVQKNISNIIDLFDKRYGVKTVYLEGAYGDVDTSWVAGGVDANYKSKLLDKMIETGRLTGAEYYSALSGKTHIIKGLETKEPYLENLKRFGDILENKDKIELILKSVDKSTQDLKNKYYDRRQFKLEQLAKDFAAGKINSEKYYILLSKHINKLGIDIYKYENTLSYMNLLTMQNDLKYAKITEELQHLVFLLKEQLPFNAYKMLLDSTGNFAQTDKLYEYLMKITRQYNLDLSVNYPELNKYFGYIELSQKINPLDLITEEKDLINEINTRFSSTKAQRDVVFMAKFEKYLENYLTSKITKEDYEYYTANIGRYKKLWDKYVDNRVLHMLDVYMAEADKFYKINTDRNEYFTKNITDGVVTEKIDAKIASAGEINKILENMRSVKRVDIIITGGFHTTSISQILNNQNLSYIVITPNVSEGTKYAEDTYYKIVKEQSKISFQTLANLIASLSPVDQIKIWNMADPESLRSSDYYKQNREQVERILSREGILSQSQMDSIKDLLQFIGYSSILESDDTGNVSEQIINLIKENLSKNSVLVQQVDEDLLKYIDIEKLSQALKQMQETDAVIKEAVEKRKLSSEGSVSQALVIIGKIINDINAVIERYQSAVSKVKSQADIEERIARINPAKYEFIKDTPILGYKITSSKFEDLPEIIRNNLGTVDRTVYTEEYLGANIGNIIALQVKDGQPDFYIVSNYREKYKEVDKAEVSQKNPKMFTKVTGITGMDELISGDKNIVGALKTAPVQMIKMSDIGYDIESEITIQSPWGEQTKPAGKEAYLVFDTTTNQYYMVNTDDTGLPLSYLVYGQTNAEVLDKVKSIMQDVGMSEEMAAYIGNDYNRQNGYAEEPVARVSQESGDAGVTKADEKTAMNLAGFYAVESGAGVISERTGKSVMEVLESIENGTISREDMLLIARFANATWKAGQFFRSPSRIGKGNFIPAVQLSNEEVQKDIDQIKAVTEKILGKMREKGLNAKSGSQEQLEYLKQLLQDKGFAIEMAQWCNDAYYRGIGQEAPEFITEADRTTSSGMTKNQQKVAMNLAGFYALETGVGYLSERSGKSFREIIDSIVDGSISEEDMLLIARFANATWKAGQPFRSLDRITRDTFRPAAMLIDSELKKDFDQIKAAAFVLQQKLDEKLENAYSEAEKGFANLDKFNEVYGAIASVISTDEDYKAVIKGIITDAVKQGQTIVEIRCAVDSLRDANGKALAPEEGAKIILDAIKGTCEELAKRGIKPPKTSLVFLGYRGTDWDQSIEAAMAEAELAVKIAESEEYQKKYSDISFGFDIAGPEDTGWAPNAFSKVYEVIRNHNAKNGAKKIGLTIHSGETPKFDRAEKSPDGYVEGTGRDGYLSIGEAVGLGVDRIGHGVQAITDPAAMEVLKNSGATVEICGVCNILSIPINTRGLQQHPIQNFLDAGVPVTICTDNNAICASDITMEYFMFLLTGHSSFMNWNMVKAVARNGISSAFISEGDKEDALKDFKQKVSRIETVLAETEIAGAEETVQKESEQPSSEPAVKETSSGTTLSVPQMKNVLNPVGAIQKTAIEIIAGRQAVEKLKEGKADVKEALVIINDIAKAEELRQEGLNAAAAVVVRKEEKSKLKGSKKIGTIGQYKGAAVRVYWNEKTKQLMFYSKEGLDGADVEVLKEMFANMQTEGIKADTFKGISQVVVTDKENYDETIKAMENSRTDAQAAIMIVKGIELDLTKRTGKINETICKNECAASGATTFIITEQQAAENSQDIEKMQKEGYKFIIKHAAVIGAESVIYDGAKIDATGLQDYNQAIKLLEGLRTKALAKGGISIKFNESIYKMLSEAGIDVWQQYGIIPSVNSDSAYIDGQIGKVEVEEITEQNIDSILSKDSVMTIVVDNAEILSDRKDAVKEAKTAKGKQKKEYKAVLNGNIPYAFNANSEADIKALISEVADIIEEDLTEEAASADVDKRAKVISHIENIQQTSFYRSLNEKARSRIDHLMKDKDAVQKTAAFIRAVAMRTAEEQILSEMAKNGIDIKTEEFRKFQDGRFREGILIRAVQLWLAGQNIVELLATEFIDSNMTAEEYMNAIMSKAEGVASNIGAICIKNEYTIRPEKDVAAAIEEFKEFNVLLQDRFRQMGIDKEVKVSVFAVKSILSAA